MWITGVLTLCGSPAAPTTRPTPPQLQVWITGVLTLCVLEPMGLSHPTPPQLQVWITGVLTLFTALNSRCGSPVS